MTHNVSTFLELVTAFSSLGDDDVIEILADLDYNDIISDTHHTPPFVLGSEDSTAPISNITINGNNHVIHSCYRDITSSAFFFHIKYLNGLMVNNLSYDNVWIYGSSNTLNGLWFSENGSNIVFNGGYFQGRSLGSIFYGTGITVQNMMITIAGRGRFGYTSSTSYQPHWERCWIHLDDVKYAQAASDSAVWVDINECYFEGELTVEGHFSNQRIFKRVSNSVINVRVSIESNNVNTFCEASNYAVDRPNVINISKVTGIEDTTDTTVNKCVTDAQLKDAGYLSSIGFNIIS